MTVRIDESWRQVLQPEFDKPYFELLTNFVRHAYATHQCFPPAKHIFRAFDLCPFDKVRVVIIGQDPYHDINQAHGLCFSVQDGVKIPPSLENPDAAASSVSRGSAASMPKSDHVPLEM